MWNSGCGSQIVPGQRKHHTNTYQYTTVRSEDEHEHIANIMKL